MDCKSYYYRRDHLGNVREVWKATDAGAQTVQRTRYYPSGLPWEYQAGDSASLQPYKYGSKEFVENHGLDMYDNHARWYDPRIMRPTTMDPLAEKYYNMSPYVWCGNNPVRNVDPTGMDIWEINNEGRIINRIKDETQDAFYMVALDAEGNYQRTYTTDEKGNKQYNSVSFKYGTVESQRSISYSPDGKTTGTYDVYQVRGDENGTKLFEFLGEHVTSSKTHVEISEAKTGIAGKHGLNFITTSHTRNSEFGMSHLFTSQLYNGYTIRELNHTHPNGRGTPSGQSEIPRWGDKGFAADINDYLKITKRSYPLYHVYLITNKIYYQFRP